MPYTHHPAPGHELVWRAQGDYLQFYYFLWLFREALLGQASWFRDPFEFVVPGISQPVWTYFFPLSPVFFLLSPLGGPLAFNALVLLSFPAAGIVTAALARQFGLSWLAAFAGGAVFALFPYRLAVMLGGHPTGFAFFLFPLVFLLTEIALKRRSAGVGLLAGLTILCLPNVDPHFLYFVGLVTPFYLWLRLPTWIAHGSATPSETPVALRRRALLGYFAPLLPAIVLGLLALGYMFYVKKTVLDASVIGGGRSLQEIRLFSPYLADFAARTQPHAGRAIYPGVVALFLAGMAVVTQQGRWTTWPLALLLVLSALLSLGPNLRAPPLYDLFYRLVPFGSFIRQTAKFQLITAFALALLAAYGVSRLEGARRLRTGIVAVAVGLLLADYFPARPVGLSTLAGNDAFYPRIREEAGTGPVLYLPIWPGESSWSSVYLYTTTVIRHPMVNGYAPAVPAQYPTTIYRPLDPMNFGEVRDEQYALLRRLGVRAVLFDRGVFPPKVTGFPSALSLENLRGSPFLEFVGSQNPFWLFRVRDHPTGLPVFHRTSPQGIFFEAEWLPRRTGRVTEDAQASGGEVVTAEQGRDLPGFIHFGPYRALPTGRYLATFRMRGEGFGARPLARVEVTAERGQRVLAQRPVDDDPSSSSRFFDIELYFEVSGPEPLEYRLEWFGQGRVKADYVYVRFAEEQDPREAFEVESLAHAMEERADPGASAGVAVFADLRSPRDELLSGPYRRYPGGSYEATFRLKVERESREPVMQLSVTLMPDRFLLARTEVRGDRHAIGQFQDVTLPFRLERPGVIEFGAQYLGSAPIALDLVRVRPAPPR